MGSWGKSAWGNKSWNEAASAQTWKPSGEWVWKPTKQTDMAWGPAPARTNGGCRDNQVSAPPSKTQLSRTRGKCEKYLPKNYGQVNYLETFRPNRETSTLRAHAHYEQAVRLKAQDPELMEEQIKLQMGAASNTTWTMSSTLSLTARTAGSRFRSTSG